MLLSIAGTCLSGTAMAAETTATVEETAVTTEEITTVVVEGSTISTEEPTVNVSGFNITFRGNVINGNLHIGTFFHYLVLLKNENGI